MKLSIITVNFNNRDGLQKTIESVVSQTFKDYEWIVIDGGSKDGSKELIEQYADHFAYWVSEPDKGIYNAMNRGICVAKGDYLLFLNSGDSLWNCDSLFLAFSHHPVADIAYADCCITEYGETIENRCYPDIMSLKEIIDYNICHNSTFFKRDLFHDNLYDECLFIASDFDFLIKKVLENRSFEHIPIILTRYDNLGISNTNNDISKKERNLVIGKLLSPSILKDHENITYLTSQKKDNRLEQVDKYCKRSLLYRKIITASLRLMCFLENKHIIKSPNNG